MSEIPLTDAPALVRAVIDGHRVELPAGASVLDAIQSLGIDHPALCHDQRLVPSGTCRSCLVRVSTRSRLVPACTTALCEGLEVETRTLELIEYRKFLLTLLARRYPADAVLAFPDKPFHRYLAQLGLTAHGAPAPHLVDISHPFIAVDMARCISCYRCVRICAEVQGQNVWHVRGRGVRTVIAPDAANLRESPCVSCGACVDTCPTGALEDAATSKDGAAERWTRTVCPYCGTGCETAIGTRDGRIVAVRPVLNAPVNKGHLCVKGRYGFEFVGARDRMTEPMLRDGDAWRRASWTDILAFTATRLRQIIDQHGPDSVGVLGSSRATNEENYLTQKFARLVIGTNNVDCCARVCHAPSAAGLKRVVGAGLATGAFDDIELARTILVWGANPTENHPIVGARIKQAVRRGAHLIVVDPRRIELAEQADVHLAIQPGTNIALLNAMAHVIVAEGLYHREFVSARVTGFDEFARFIEQWTPERAAALCGVDAEAIRIAARLYASQRPSISVHGLGLTEHGQGTDGVVALVNLALLTGNIGSPGTGVNPLRGQNNVQGAAHMGCDPGALPGSVLLESARSRFERVWGRPLPRAQGLHLMQMIDAAVDGRLKALWAIGYDILLTNPNITRTRRALESMELVIVQDLFLTLTAREFGTVFLPACSSFEKDGTFMNAERRIQRVRKAIAPVGNCRSDSEIICGLARAMGCAEGFQFEHSEDIWNEVRSVCDGARGMSYDALEKAGLQWPCPSEGHPGTPRLHTQVFASGEKAVLRSVDARPSDERPSEEYPLILVTGRSLYQFNAGTMTSRGRLLDLRRMDYLDISDRDANRLGVRDGDLVKVTSAYGEVVLPIHRSRAVPPGQLFATFQADRVLVNAVTGLGRDQEVGTPEYKVTAVQVAPLSS